MEDGGKASLEAPKKRRRNRIRLLRNGRCSNGRVEEEEEKGVRDVIEELTAYIECEGDLAEGNGRVGIHSTGGKGGKMLASGGGISPEDSLA